MNCLFVTKGFVLFCYFFWIVGVLGFGSILIFPVRFISPDSNSEIKNEMKIAVFGIFGFVVLAVIGTIANLVMPLNQPFSVVMLITGIVLFLVNRKLLISWMTKKDWIIVIFLAANWSLLPLLDYRSCTDTGLYHLPVIKWMKETTTPFGLVNLHERLGFNQSWFVVAAILEPMRLIAQYPFFIINSILMFFYGSAIFLVAVNLFKKNSLSDFFESVSLSDLFLLFSIIPYFSSKISRAYAKCPSPDLAIMIIIFFLTYFIIYEVENWPNTPIFQFLMLVVSAFAITIKLSIMPYSIGLFVICFVLFMVKNNRNNIFQNVQKTNLRFIVITLVSIGLIFIPHIVRGVILSGCILYPLGHFYDFKWAVSLESCKSMSNIIKCWARMPGGNYMESLDNWNWLVPWIQRNIVLLKQPIILGIVGNVLVFISIVMNKRGIKKTIPFLVPFILSIGGILFWFLKAPDIRFGCGYLYSVSILIFCFGLVNLLHFLCPLIKLIPVSIKKRKLAFLISILVFVTIFTHLLKIRYRQVFQFYGYKFITPELIKKVTTDGITIFTMKGGNQPWDAPLLSTPYFHPDLKVEFSIDGKPRMFWYEKGSFPDCMQ